MPDYLKARLFEILSLLLKIRRYVTLQELADKLGVSKRTIQHDVERVELWLKECGLENSATLLRKQALGIRLELKGNAENELEALLRSQSTRGQSFDNYERRLEGQVPPLLPRRPDAPVPGRPGLRQQGRHQQGPDLGLQLAQAVRPGHHQAAELRR